LPHKCLLLLESLCNHAKGPGLDKFTLRIVCPCSHSAPIIE